MTYTKAQQKKNRKKWLKALRSGKYEQTTGALKNSYEDSFCCLGVLCDVYKKDVKAGDWNGAAFVDKDGACTSSVPPPDVVSWVGLNCDDGEYKTKKGKINWLPHLNDNSRMSFKQIANIIEKEPDGMFKS
jgi:hypothetical protein